MDFKSYNMVIFALTMLPCILVFIIGCIVSRCFQKHEALLLIFMKSIISRKNIDKRPTYLVCNRKVPSSSRGDFMLYSLLIFANCVQIVLVVAIVDVTYECIHDPDLVCFKERDDVKLFDFDYNTWPVNCSTISRDDFVICYRWTVFDPERAFVGAVAGYLLFKMINIGIFVVAYVMIWVHEQKLGAKKMGVLKVVLISFILVVMLMPFMSLIYLEQARSAIRKVSFTLLFQLIFVVPALIYFVIGFPWQAFAESNEYYGDASLPGNVDADDNEMT